MNQTPSQHLPYPDEDDPANGALQLQVLAEAIDAKLVSEFAQFRAVVNRPAFIANITSTQSFGSPGGSISWDTFSFNSMTSTGTGSLISIYEPGYWMVGAFMQSNPSGGITADSYLYAQLTWTDDLVLPLGATTTDQFYATNFQSSTGGEYQTVVGIVRQEYDGVVSRDGRGLLALDIIHANVASSVVVATSTFMWGFKISDLEDL